MPGNGGMPGAEAPPGGMRVLVLNARTAVLVPADTLPLGPDAEAADEAAEADDAAWTNADTRDAAPDTPADADASERVASLPDAAEADATPPDRQADLAAAMAAEAPSPAATDDGWQRALLSRLDDLGRLMAAALAPRAAEPHAEVAALAAALDRVEQRLAADVTRINTRLDWLDGVLEEMAQQGVAQAGPGGDGAALSLPETVADLQMQIRMVEAQVSSLGRILVSGPDGTSSEALRTWMAERVATEQRLAAGL